MGRQPFAVGTMDVEAAVLGDPPIRRFGARSPETFSIAYCAAGHDRASALGPMGSWCPGWTARGLAGDGLISTGRRSGQLKRACREAGGYPAQVVRAIGFLE